MQMKKDKETPGERRERLRQEELKRNPAGSFQGGGFQDFIGDFGGKVQGYLSF